MHVRIETTSNDMQEEIGKEIARITKRAFADRADLLHRRDLVE